MYSPEKRQTTIVNMQTLFRVHVCMNHYECVYIYTHVHAFMQKQWPEYECVCMCVYIYIHIYIYVYVQKQGNELACV